MGTDTPISALSDKPKLLYTYFKQNFAQVTNPPIDPIREELVMSLVSFIGPRPNIFDLEGNSKRKRLEVRQPILTNDDLEKIRCISFFEDAFDTKTLDITYPAKHGAEGMEASLTRLCERAEAAVRRRLQHHHPVGPHDGAGPHPDPGAARDRGRASSPDPQGPAHLGRPRGRDRRSARGASLRLPGRLWRRGHQPLSRLRDAGGAGARSSPRRSTRTKRCKRFIKSIDKGLLKVMSKMGISTYQSYCGAQIFDAVGLSDALRGAVLHRHAHDDLRASASPRSRPRRCGATPTPSATARSTATRSTSAATMPTACAARRIPGRRRSVSLLQHAVRGNCRDKYRAYAKLLNEQDERLLTIRGLFRIKTRRGGRPRSPCRSTRSSRSASIVKRFATGAMSYGSISREAHTTLAIAMNRIGGKSNTGEGGEESDRFKPLPNGDSMRSAIKQVASGRFGVTTEYLVNSDMMQIKMAQGAKPGEGGQLPGHKVDAIIAKVRHSTPGVGLISPPPHHDIYSIEDLAQLIYDLKNVNPTGQVSVKLVSEIGVGTVAAGVSKARADHVTIAGFEGGTGASPLTSIKHAGSPVGDRPRRDPPDAGAEPPALAHRACRSTAACARAATSSSGALLGADEFGCATAPLIAAGCIMMRKCHLNTCPVGVATQDPVLRKRFVGQPEHVINFFFFVAEEVRELMAQMGYRTLRRDDRPDADARPRPGDRALEGQGARLRASCSTSPQAAEGDGIHNTEAQDHNLGTRARPDADRRSARPRSRRSAPVMLDLPITNTDRTTGAMLSGEIAKRYGHAGLPDGTIHVKLTGTAGQSFGAFVAKGVTLELEGEANDYVGKGLSGGRLIVYPSRDARPRSCRRSRSSSATRCSTAPSRASATSAASRASASRCATPARSRSSRARATMAANT